LVHHIYLTRRQERGNYLVITALLLTVLIGMLALVVDIGFAAGQRRFMQNGADAAALAAADLMSGAVLPYPDPFNPPWPQNIPSYFGVTDDKVFERALDYATKNQNSLISQNTSPTVTVEYCVAANSTSYRPQYRGCTPADDSRNPAGNHWVTNTNSSGARPPDGTFKVRVTVNSTISTTFGRVIGQNTTSSVGVGVAVILGVCEQSLASGNTMPFTLWDGQALGVPPDQFFTGNLFQLWSSNPPAPNNGDSSWKNVIDLSPATIWCDGRSPDYEWAVGPSFAGMVPAGTACTPNLSDPTKNFTGADTSWNRDDFQPDQRGGVCTGSATNPDDVYMWISAGFDGTVGINMKVPTYMHRGDNGQNIADAIWGTTPNACNGQYFFQGVTAVDPAHPTWGVYRDVTVFTYDVPPADQDFYKINGNSSSGWTNSNNQSFTLGRVTLIHALNVRIYSDPPGRNSSEVIGLVVSPADPPNYVPQNCPDFGTLGPGIFGNVVRLGS
jgi:hypothetical protein